MCAVCCRPCISIHALLAESDRRRPLGRPHRPHFYPRSPCGERLPALPLPPAPWAFLSTLSLRRATCSSRWRNSTGRYFYPRSPCGERRSAGRRNGTGGLFLSTLSLRRATYAGPRLCARQYHFYPRSPCGERLTSIYLPPKPQNFYPRSPCGERPGYMDALREDSDISIHALLAESDHTAVSRKKGEKEFLSTLSLRRATSKRCERSK